MQSTKVVDNEAITLAVTDYYEGWYTPDENRMQRCLHADLAKRAIRSDGSGEKYLLHLTKEIMLDATIQGGGSASAADRKNWTITILDQYEEIATVQVVSVEYMEYIHLAKQSGQWQIVNVLWTDNRENE
jgi:hypothetical protein